MLSAATIPYGQHEMYLHGQVSAEIGTSSWDMKMLTRIIDQRMMVAAQQLRHGSSSNIEDLLGLDKVQTDDLWRLDLESVQNLKGTWSRDRRSLIV